MSETMIALQAGLSIEGITMYLFWVGLVAMGGGALFFWLSMGNIPKEYRSVNIVAGIICAVAAFHYYKMSGIYVEALAISIKTGEAIGQFPTAYRYIDWFITVPLLVLEFPLLLRLGKESKGIFRGLVLGAIVMLITAWVAEESPLGSGSWWGWYLVSCAAWAYIVFVLFTQVSKAMETAPKPIASSAATMRGFILIGWAIYPIGFLMALAGPGGESIREICYNVADVINKVGFGLVCYAGAKALTQADNARA